ncbi:hypothetical protein D3C73_1400930 [compost metagenome]
MASSAVGLAKPTDATDSLGDDRITGVSSVLGAMVLASRMAFGSEPSEVLQSPGRTVPATLTDLTLTGPSLPAWIPSVSKVSTSQ